VQPQLVHGYSPTGFEHIKLPKETFKWLKEWYDEEQKNIEQKETSSGFFIFFF
jgi:hypothetical protein